MRNELTNLLPLGRQRTIRRDYFIRLCVIVSLLVAVLSIAAAALLLPTYVFLSASERAGKIQLTNIESTISSSAEDAAFSEQFSALSNSTAILSGLAGTQSVISIIRSALGIAHPGIALSGFIYSPASIKNQDTLAISGVAATRDALRNYQLALQSALFARSADLPVSAYAKDTEITFTITVNLAP